MNEAKHSGKSVTPDPGRLRQEDHKFKAYLGYIEFLASLAYIRRPCLKKKKKKRSWLIVVHACNTSNLGG
jgi:hypothetical protein